MGGILEIRQRLADEFASEPTASGPAAGGSVAQTMSNAAPSREPETAQGHDPQAERENAPAAVAEIAAGPDILGQALIDVARHYGKPSTIAAVTAGLPLVGGRLPLQYVDEAAERAGLLTEETGLPLEQLPEAAFPVLLLYEDHSLHIIWSIDKGGRGAKAVTLSLPGAGAGQFETLTLDAVRKLAPKRVIRLKPLAKTAYNPESDAGIAPKNWFLPAFRSSWSIYGEAIAATFAINILALSMPLFTMNVYDRVLPNAAIETLWALAIGVCLATVFDFVIKALRARFVDVAGRRADVLLANMIFGRLLGAKMALRPTSTGVRVNTLREFETLREFFNSLTLTALGDLPFLFFFIGIIAVVGGPLALIPLAAIPIILAIGWATQRLLGRLLEESFKETGQKTAVLVEMLSGLDTLKAANAESYAAGKWEQIVAENIRVTHKIRHVSTLGQLSIQATQGLTQILIVVFGFFLLVDGKLTMGALIASTMLTGRALQPLGQLAGIISRLHQARIAYRSLTEIVNAPQEAPAGKALVENAAPLGRIEFDNVTFSYDAHAAPALKGVSFNIEPGERVAIIGGIGTGKSTALRLVQGHFSPDSGRVLIDGIPASQINPAALRGRVGLALQHAELFQGTIRDNIAVANPGAADGVILAAAQVSGALDWVLRLPLGLQTPIGERGAGLSGGQRQSIALARALFGQPKVLLLDEPTSDMDPRTESAIVKQLGASFADSTMIIVTHRPALLELADRLIVLEGGQKLLDGPKASVMKSLQAMMANRKKQTSEPSPSPSPSPGPSPGPSSSSSQASVETKYQKARAQHDA